MFGPTIVFCHVVDDDGLPALPDFMTDRRLHLQLAARLQPKVDLIQNATRHPPVLSYAGDRCESHAGGAAPNVKDGRYRLYPAYAFDVGLKVLRLSLLLLWHTSRICQAP